MFSGTPQALLVLILWLPITFYLFSRFPPRTAVIVSFIGGLLFLPQKAGFVLPLIPDYQGMTASCYGIILGVIVYDAQRLIQFKPKWMDIPMLIWCICPVFSSLANNLGLYDGINQALEQIAIWGLPYFLGRLYLSNLAGLQELAINIVKGGLIYVPLCLYEIRMSPQLHKIVYGYYQHDFAQTIRLGGYRPTVFMQHGLQVGMWMMLATLVALWLWQAKTVRKIWGIQMSWIVVVLIITIILIKSTGAYGYFLYGVIVMFMAKWVRTNLPLLLLIAVISYYLFLGVTGNFDGKQITDWISTNISADRAQSLQFRWDNEKLLGEKAREQMLFGWGGWSRNRVYEENWQGDLVDISVTDSLWIIAFGNRGVFGLASLTTAVLLPVVRLCLKGYPVRTWFNPKIAPVAVLAVGLTMFFLDCLVNAMILPIFPLISGGLSGINFQQTTQTRKTKSAKLPRYSVSASRRIF